MHCTPGIGQDKQGLSIGLSIGSVKFKHERNAIMQHQPVYIWSSFLSNLLWKPPGTPSLGVVFFLIQCNWFHAAYLSLLTWPSMNQVLQDQSHDCTLNNLIHIKCTLSIYCTLFLDIAHCCFRWVIYNKYCIATLCVTVSECSGNIVTVSGG